jgi:hypothetical protein
MAPNRPRGENQQAISWDRRADFDVVAMIRRNGTFLIEPSHNALDQEFVHRLEDLRYDRPQWLAPAARACHCMGCAGLLINPTM